MSGITSHPFFIDMTSSSQVLIVGSGPAGLTLALALLQNGVPVRIIDKDTKYHFGERGSGVQPRTLEIEHFLGVGEDVLQAGMPSPSMIIFDPKDPYRVAKSHEMIKKVPPTSAFPITDARMIGQWLHEQILRTHLEKLGCCVELGCALVSLEQHENEVSVHLAKTKDGKESQETAEFAYVIGADGARSTVRKSLGIDFVGESQEVSVFHVDARVEGLPAVGKDFLRWEEKGVKMAALKYTVKPGVFHLMLAGRDLDYDALRTGTVEAIDSAFRKLSGRSDIKVTEVFSHDEWRPNIRLAEHFRVDRVFLIGDASHAHPPTGAQGLNTSIQDAFNLAWKLALTLKSQASPHLLDSYEFERLPVVAEMLKLTTDLFKQILGQMQLGTQRALEAAKDSEAEKRKAEQEDDSAYTRDRRLLQLNINYRWSGIVFDERFKKGEKDAGGGKEESAYGVAGHDVRAGDRAPDATGLVRLDRPKEGEKPITRLFDLFSTSSHSALIFSPDHTSAETRDILAALAKLPKGLVQTIVILPASSSQSAVDTSSSGADFVFADADDHAYKDYGLDASSSPLPTAVIIRPDASIGAFALSKTGVEKYLSLVFSPTVF